MYPDKHNITICHYKAILNDFKKLHISFTYYIIVFKIPDECHELQYNTQMPLQIMLQQNAMLHDPHLMKYNKWRASSLYSLWHTLVLHFYSYYTLFLQSRCHSFTKHLNEYKKSCLFLLATFNSVGGDNLCFIWIHHI